MTCPCRTSVIIWWFLVAVLLDEELIVWIRYCIGCTHNAMAHFVHDCRGDKRRTKRFSSLSYASVVCTYGNVPVDKFPLVTTPFFAWIGFPCNKAGRTFSNCLLLGMWKTLSFRRQSWRHKVAEFGRRYTSRSQQGALLMTVNRFMIISSVVCSYGGRRYIHYCESIVVCVCWLYQRI